MPDPASDAPSAHSVLDLIAAHPPPIAPARPHAETLVPF